MMNFDKRLSLVYAVRFERELRTVGDLTVIYALYELELDGNRAYAVALSDGETVVYRLLHSQAAARELFETALDGEVDTASFSGIADDLLCNNIL